MQTYKLLYELINNDKWLATYKQNGPSTMLNKRIDGHTIKLIVHWNDKSYTVQGDRIVFSKLFTTKNILKANDFVESNIPSPLI